MSDEWTSIAVLAITAYDSGDVQTAVQHLKRLQGWATDQGSGKAIHPLIQVLEIKPYSSLSDVAAFRESLVARFEHSIGQATGAFDRMYRLLGKNDPRFREVDIGLSTIGDIYAMDGEIVTARAFCTLFLRNYKSGDRPDKGKNTTFPLAACRIGLTVDKEHLVWRMIAESFLSSPAASSYMTEAAKEIGDLL